MESNNHFFMALSNEWRYDPERAFRDFNMYSLVYVTAARMDAYSIDSISFAKFIEEYEFG